MTPLTTFRLMLLSAITIAAVVMVDACGSTPTAPSQTPTSNQPGVTPITLAPPSANITSPINGETVRTASITVRGNFSPADLAATKDLWVIVFPQMNDRGYPQSPNAQRGDPALIDQAGRTWSTPTALGGPNQRYRIAIYTAESGASNALRDHVSGWWLTGRFLGLTAAQMPQPPGLTEMQSIMITKEEPPASIAITSHRNGDVVNASTITVFGSYAPQTLVDDRQIWVLVWPEQAGGKAYPQSPNAGGGDPATLNRAAQTWSTPVSLGGPPQTYRLSVHTADAEASRFLHDTIITWTRNGDYAGLFPDQLPTGLVEFANITIRKQ